MLAYLNYFSVLCKKVADNMTFVICLNITMDMPKRGRCLQPFFVA